MAGALLFGASQAQAVRPFVTDDAEVVGYKQAQLETWVQFDQATFEHNMVAAFGPTTWLELTMGMVHALSWQSEYAINGPLLQAKAAFWPLPDEGVTFAAVAGAAAPWGIGELEAPGWGAFGYLVMTASLNGGAQLIHLNAGLSGADTGSDWHLAPTFGLGVQARLWGGLHGVVETFYADPYDPYVKLGVQTGLRYFFSEELQIDATGGTQVQDPGAYEPWFSIGVRIVSPP